jgi:hypothetical protein
VQQFHRLLFVATVGFLTVLLAPALVSANSPATTPLVSDKGGVVIYDDRTDFNTDAPGLPLEDWEEGHVQGPFVFCNPPLNSMSNDACFLPGEILPGLEYQDSILGGGTDHVGLGAAGLFSMPSKFVYTNYSAESTNLYFTPTVTALGLDISSNGIDNVINLSIYAADGSLIITDTSMVQGLGSLNFWGVISNTPIERLNIEILNGEFVDNVVFGNAVPPTAVTVTTINATPGIPISNVAIGFPVLIMAGMLLWRRRK